MEPQDQILTRKNICIATRVLQAIDMEAERVFSMQHAADAQRQPGMTESDVSSLTQDLIESTPGQILLMDGNGYRVLISLLANTCLAIDRADLAEVVLESRECEET